MNGRFAALLTNALLVFVSICAALLIGEVVLRLAFPQDLSGSSDVYTKDGLLANKSAGTAFHQMGARRVEYHFGAPHLRILDGDLFPANGVSRKVLVVGDSYTFGWLLSDRDTYVRHLEDYLNAARSNGCPRVRLLDAAVGGWGAADYTIYIRRYLPVVRPDYLLVFVNTDDIGRALRSPLISFNGKLMFREGPPHRLKALICSLPFYNYLLEHFHVAALVRRVIWAIGSGNFLNGGRGRSQKTITVFGNDYSGPSDSALSTMLGEALFGQIIRVCNANHTRLIVLTTGFMKFMTPNNPTGAFYRDLPSFLEAHDVPFIDVSNQLAAATRGHLTDYLDPVTLHPNEKGDALVAALIWPHLRDLLPELTECKTATPGSPSSALAAPTSAERGGIF